MPTITSRLATSSASAYLQQLCKHFDHKAPATWSETYGQVTFEQGNCEFLAFDNEMVFIGHAETADDLQRLLFVVEIHLVRFAWREGVELTWYDDHGAVFAKTDDASAKLAEERAKFAEKRAK